MFYDADGRLPVNGGIVRTKPDMPCPSGLKMVS